ncbi:MAG: M23 family metallopeptidase [Candidatus Cloacimonadaceae bacterium]
MNPFKIRRQWKVTYQYGLDGIRRELNLSNLVLTALAVVLLCVLVLSVLYLSDVKSLGSSEEKAALNRENALLRDKLEFYSATIDTIYQQLDSLQLLNHNGSNGDDLYPYSPVADDALMENAFIYDTYLDAKVNRAEQQIQSISLILNSGSSSGAPSESALMSPTGGPAIFPTFGRISDGWGVRMHPIYRRLYFHRGIDIANKIGTPIYAAAEGEIVLTGYDKEYGKIIKIKHDDMFETRYGHLHTFKVAIGDKVRKGQIIALMGSTGMSTGPHLHYEVLVDGAKVNPARYLNRIEEPVYYARQ